MPQKALSRNLQSNYPPSPREVVKYFSEITQCFYNEEHTDEELKDLALKMREIYDDELVANQTEEEYLDLLKKDIDEYRLNGRSISGYPLLPVWMWNSLRRMAMTGQGFIAFMI